jgi:hypothetical protein
MYQQLALFFGKVYLVILVVNVVLVLLFYKRLPSKIRSLSFFLLGSLATDFASRWFFYQGANNLFLLHIYTLWELLAWSWFFYLVFELTHRERRLYFGGIGLAGVLLLLNSLFLEPLTGFNSNAKTLVQVLLVSFAIRYFFLAFGKIDLTKPVARSVTFINFAVLLYYSGTLFIFMSSKLLKDYGVASSQQHGLWVVNALLLVVFHFLILLSIWTPLRLRPKY